MRSEFLPNPANTPLELLKAFQHNREAAATSPDIRCIRFGRRCGSDCVADAISVENARITSALIAKFTFCGMSPSAFAMPKASSSPSTMPITFPLSSKSGPPLLPEDVSDFRESMEMETGGGACSF
jgi:hypothetical protein